MSLESLSLLTLVLAGLAFPFLGSPPMVYLPHAYLKCVQTEVKTQNGWQKDTRMRTGSQKDSRQIANGWQTDCKRIANGWQKDGGRINSMIYPFDILCYPLSSVFPSVSFAILGKQILRNSNSSNVIYMLLNN